MNVVERVYALTRGFPKTELYGLSSQMQRAAISVPANIAEGHARDSTRDFARYVSIALGSLAELETHLLLAERMSLGNADGIKAILSDCDEVGRMLRGLQKSLKAKIDV